ncbi:type IV pilus assembly protein PilX [Gammaproteobacteria bacterium]
MSIKINHQRGVVLILALVILLVMTMIGVSAMQSSTLNEKMAGNMNQRNMAFQAAEAALRAAESFLEPETSLPTFDNTGANIGLRPAISNFNVNLMNYWLNVYDWIATNGGNDAGSVLYTGTWDPALDIQSRYVIERLPFITMSCILVGSNSAGSIIAPVTNYWYRITTRGMGGIDNAVVILQANYRKSSVGTSINLTTGNGNSCQSTAAAASGRQSWTQLR